MHASKRALFCAGAAIALSLAAPNARAAGLGSLNSAAGVLLALVAALIALRSSVLPQAGGLAPWGGGALLLLAAAALWCLHRQASVALASALLRLRQPAAPSSATTVATVHKPAAITRLDEAQRLQLLDDARSLFLTLQTAWDRGDLHALEAMTTPHMLEELTAELRMHRHATNRTDVLTLDAQLLGCDAIGPALIATVEFSGIIREAPELGAAPFRELWMLTRSNDSPAGWRLARHQALL